MRALSISRAWDETKAILARDGKLFVSLSLALVAFPTLVSGIVNPRGIGEPGTTPLWISVVALIASLIALAGQLALIRLALGPSVTVGAAINHGLRRLPIYFLAGLLILVGMFILAIPFVAALMASGVQVTENRLPPTPSVYLALLAYLMVAVFVGVRMAMSAPVASAEHSGPFKILRRSWDLTSGQFWRLLGFLLIYFLGAIILLYAVSISVGVGAQVAFGPIEPMSVSALLVALVHSLLNAVLTAVLAIMLARIYVQLAGRGETESGLPITGI